MRLNPFLAESTVVAALGCAAAWNWTALVGFRCVAGLGIGGTSWARCISQKLLSLAGAVGYSAFFNSTACSGFCWLIFARWSKPLPFVFFRGDYGRAVRRSADCVSRDKRSFARGNSKGAVSGLSPQAP